MQNATVLLSVLYLMDCGIVRHHSMVEQINVFKHSPYRYQRRLVSPFLYPLWSFVDSDKCQVVKHQIILPGHGLFSMTVPFCAPFAIN